MGKLSKILKIRYQYFFSMIVLLFVFGFDVKGQGCEQTLEDAQKYYEQGLLQEIPPLLKSCINFGFDKRQKERSYKLLILTYLFSDEIEKAEEYLLKLLTSNPQFALTAIDPPELVHLYNGFRTKSVFSIEIKGGINNSFINTLRVNGVGNSPYSYQAYKNKVGIQLGAGINFRVLKNVELAAEINLVNQRFDQVDSIRTTLFTDAERPSGYNFTAIEAGEDQTWIEFPVAIKYGFKLKKIYPFVYIGASTKYLLNAELSISRINVDPSDIETPQRRVEGPSINLVNARIRNKFHYSLLGGAGFKYQIGIDYLIFNVRYSMGMANLRNKNTALDANNELLYRYGYIDNDFKLNLAAISIGYVKPFYKPKKLKKRN